VCIRCLPLLDRRHDLPPQEGAEGLKRRFPKAYASYADGFANTALTIDRARKKLSQPISGTDAPHARVCKCVGRERPAPPDNTGVPGPKYKQYLAPNVRFSIKRKKNSHHSRLRCGQKVASLVELLLCHGFCCECNGKLTITFDYRNPTLGKVSGNILVGVKSSLFVLERALFLGGVVKTCFLRVFFLFYTTNKTEYRHTSW
jgi:hypothetical protein